MRSSKKWSIAGLVTTLALLLLAAALIVIVDPYFHYHAPLPKRAYSLSFQRYQNDGIVRNLRYDAIITGSSMAENFSATQLDRLFGVKTVKVPFSGGSYKELRDNLIRALEANGDIRLIVWGLDYNLLMEDKDILLYPSETYPRYLYDDRLFNDVQYVLNKEVLLSDTLYILCRVYPEGAELDFDAYSRWMGSVPFGKEAVDKVYVRPAQSNRRAALTDAERERLEGNLRQNVIALAEENPQIEFYLFFTPYSIYYWDSQNRQGTLERQLEAERLAIELLTACDNIRLFSFFDEFDMVCNMENYMDIGHYSADINAQILDWMRAGEHRITRENAAAYCERVYDFYTHYDYDALFAE